jgi:hypothetical protein
MRVGVGAWAVEVGKTLKIIIPAIAVMKAERIATIISHFFFFASLRTSSSTFSFY